jgi:hypothetical protein
MRLSLLASHVLLTAAAALVNTPAAAQWADNGVNVCAARSAQTQPLTLADGNGGAFIVWTDVRSSVTGTSTGFRDIYAQHLDASGGLSAGWPVDGLVVCDAPGDQTLPAIAGDGKDGFYVAWQDHRGADNDLYMSRFNADGTLGDGWTKNGSVIGSTAANQQSPTLASDGTAGVLVVWSDSRDGNFDIRALHLDSSGNIFLAPGQGPARNVQAPNPGNLICGAAGDQTVPVAIPDGLGGNIVVWQDGRTASSDIYGARVLESGQVDATWTPNGVLVSNSALGFDLRAREVSDGAGGAIVAWTATDEPVVRAQRLSRLGRIEWAAQGVPAGAGSSGVPIPIASDGAGGAFVASVSGTSIYIQRLNGQGVVVSGWPAAGFKFVATGTSIAYALLADGSGGVYASCIQSQNLMLQHVTAAGTIVTGWPAAGQVFCAVPQFATNLPTMVSDGAGGAIVAWQDSRGGVSQTGLPTDDIYAQRVLPMGLTGMYLGALASVADVSADQGGWVALNIQAPTADFLLSSPGVTGYNVWRLVSAPQSAPSASAASGGGPALVEQARTSPILLRAAQAASAGFPPGSWQSLGFNAATQSTSYAVLEPTRNDSTAAGLASETYLVTVHTPSPAQYTVTAPLSGHSTDNLPPAAPLNLAAARAATGGLDLAWSANTERDLAGYSVYRGSDAAFAPQPGNRIGTPAVSAFRDDGFIAGSWYKVTARDRHGNESPVAVFGSSQVVGAPSAAATVDFLARPAPDPFTRTTALSFGLARAGHAELTVQDIAGRRVRTLISGAHAAGQFTLAWNGDDDDGRALPPGVYLVRLRYEGGQVVRRIARVE